MWSGHRRGRVGLWNRRQRAGDRLGTPADPSAAVVHEDEKEINFRSRLLIVVLRNAAVSDFCFILCFCWSILYET